MEDFESARNTKLTVLQKAVILLSGGLFVSSLFQQAFYIDRIDYDAWADSKMLVFFGWSAILEGNAIATLIWLANPLFFIAIIFLLNQKSSGFYLSIVATLISTRR
ncbi:hypothetical protein QMK33_08890 [Hymenobacter sp. H14-R3]|uniref:hypothetical protein n=1 Tax=Hymenobacter sp. H14-R3 TaxID=3046308 RepID=UPI0024B9D154|nr:hypothetical protein [Hymenobacter sp. H14-R3]MDJ0365268.1 hypothetical protein [Hymenobacter sp. H14-R3]